MSDEVEVTTAVVTIQRPEVGNCVAGETCEALRRFVHDSSFFLAILAGTEDDFCAGADLR